MAVTEPNRQQERREASTRALLHAAGELILEGGFSAMTFAAIGERSGYSRSMVTARFGSKDGLVEELMSQLVGSWSHSAVEQVDPESGGLGTILALIDAIRVQVAKNSQGLRVLYALMFEGLGDEALLRERFRSFHGAQRHDLAERIRMGQGDGSVVVGLDPDAEAAFIVTGMRGIGYQWLIDPEGFDATAAFTHFRDLVHDRLAT